MNGHEPIPAGLSRVEERAWQWLDDLWLVPWELGASGHQYQCIPAERWALVQRYAATRRERGAAVQEAVIEGTPHIEISEAGQTVRFALRKGAS